MVHLVLNLDDNAMDNVDLGKILKSFTEAAPCLPVELYLGGNRLTSNGCKSLSSVLGMSGAQCLDLSSNEMDCKAVSGLVKASGEIPSGRSGLLHLSLRDNNIMEAGAASLSSILKAGAHPASACPSGYSE